MKIRLSELYGHSKSRKYKKRKPRRDPVGGEDSDVNNDGKIDLNDKYLKAKRELYRNYLAAQKSKSQDIQVPTVKLENSMIKLSGLVNFEVLKEEEKWIQAAIKRPGALHKALGVPEDETIPVEKLKAAAEKGGRLGKQARLAMTLRKLKESDKLTEEQYNKVCEMEEVLVGGQKKLDADKDGKITANDFKILRTQKEGTESLNEVDYEMDQSNDDHEGRMAKSDLLALHKQAGELYNMLGDNEELEGWVQSKITLAADYIGAVYNNLQYEKSKPLSIGTGMGAPADSQTTPTGPKAPMAESVIAEKAPEGWEATVKKMKKKKEIDNPWALAHWMKKKGYHPKNENVDTKDVELEEATLEEAPRKLGKKMSSIVKKLDAAVAKNKAASDALAKKYDTTATVKNPETGNTVLATTAIKDKDHPAYNAAKSALGK